MFADARGGNLTYQRGLRPQPSRREKRGFPLLTPAKRARAVLLAYGALVTESALTARFLL